MRGGLKLSTFECQRDAYSVLSDLASNNRHSVLIDGPAGCGKSWLAKQYANMLNIPDFQIVDPTVQAIRDAISSFYELNTPIVLCIENLDLGVSGASYSLLKFLEEPSEKAYIVVTCRNIRRIPDTIASRCATTTVAAPSRGDIAIYSESRDASRYNQLKSLPIWRCVRSFADAEYILSLSAEQLEYFNSLQYRFNLDQPVSQLMWDLGHYPDNTESPVGLVIQYISLISNNPCIMKIGLDCLNDLDLGRIAKHVILAKFCMDSKYTTL